MNNNQIDTEEFIPEIKDEEPVYRKPLNILKKRRATIALIIALSLVALAGLTFLAYKLFTPNIAPMNETFYFMSDLLSDKPGKEYTAYKSIDFMICNYADELRSSRKNIDDVSFRISYGDEDITTKCKIDCSSYKLSSKERSSSDVSITVPDEYYGLPVNVTVESFPISNKLYGTFTVYGDWGYEIGENTDEYVCRMTIWSNTDIDLKISWDPKFVTPDYTNLLIYEYSIDDILSLAGDSISSRTQTDEAAVFSEEEQDGSGEDESEEPVLKGKDNIITENGLSTKVIRLPAGTSTVIPMFKSVSSDNYLRGNNKAKISVEAVSRDNKKSDDGKPAAESDEKQTDSKKEKNDDK